MKHTDVDDFEPVMAEAARVLTPGGVFAFFGAHRPAPQPRSRQLPHRR